MSTISEKMCSGTASASVFGKLAKSIDTLSSLGQRAWFHYLTIFLLQLKVVWGMWKYRDLTFGDTSYYFVNAYRWYTNLTVDIAWSPLYTAFYGTLLHLTTDVYYVTIVHRLIIIFLLVIMILSLMRRLLPPNIAWFMTAWWAILPVNFNALYEVHLFAVIPVLACWLLILRNRSPWDRGGALAILLVSALLVRNEIIVGVLILFVICIWWEMRLRQKATATQIVSPSSYLKAYGVPILIAAMLTVFAYTHSIFRFPSLSKHLADKHSMNMSQVYGCNYHQRYPEWDKNWMMESVDLMERDFGEQKWLSLGEMVKKNPKAVCESVLWSFSLVPSGIQVLLFNVTSGNATPDYIPVNVNAPVALTLSTILLAVLTVGGLRLYAERRYWWNSWLEARAIGWLAMVAVALVALPVIATQRPRPAFLFPLGILLMACTGMCLFAIIRRWAVLDRLSNWVPLLILIIVIGAPSFYAQPDNREQPRLLLQLYRRLSPFADVMGGKYATRPLVSGYGSEVANYLQSGWAPGLDYAIFKDAPQDMPLASFLENYGVNFFYVDKAFEPILKTHPQYQTFFDSPQSFNWKMIAYEETQEDKWAIYKKIGGIVPDRRIVRARGASVPR